MSIMIKQKLFAFLNDKKKQNFVIYGLGQAFNLISPIFVAPIVVSICHVEGLGKMGFGFALALFLILIVDYGFDIKGTKQASESRDNLVELQKLLNLIIASKVVLFLIALIIGLFLIFCVPFFYHEKKLFLLSLTIVFAQIFNPLWFLQGIENFKLVSVLNIGSKILYVLLVFFLVTQKEDYIFVNLFLGISALLFNVLGLCIIKIKYKLQICLPFFHEIITVIKNDFSFCVSQLFLSARQLSPLVLTGFFIGYTIAGQYKIIEQVITLFRTFIQVFLKFFYPSVCFKYKQSKTEGIAFWKKYATFVFVFVFVMLLIIFIFSEDVLRFFHLSEVLILQLSLIFKISLIVSMLMSISLPLEQLMFVTNKNKNYIIITIIATIVNISLILLFINSFKLYAIIISLIISELFFIGLYSKSTMGINKKNNEN